MYLQFEFCENPLSGFWDYARQKIFYQKLKKPLSNAQFKILKKSKNILAILFLNILHMPNFKKLALIAAEIWGKTWA